MASPGARAPTLERSQSAASDTWSKYGELIATTVQVPAFTCQGSDRPPLDAKKPGAMPGFFACLEFIVPGYYFFFFFAAVFLAGAFFTAFLAEAFFGAAFLAAVFLAAFLAGAFFAAFLTANGLPLWLVLALFLAGAFLAAVFPPLAPVVFLAADFAEAFLAAFLAGAFF